MIEQFKALMYEHFPDYDLSMNECDDQSFLDSEVNAMWIMYQILKSEPIPLPPMDGSEIIVIGGYLDTDDQSHGMKTDDGGMVVRATRSGKFVLVGFGYIVRPTHWRPLPIPPLATEGGV